MKIVPETDAERWIVADPNWTTGVAWGAAREGHPEGLVFDHVCEVLANIEEVAIDARDRERLRFVALVHDAFKHQVDPARPRTGGNHHAVLARRFAERFTQDLELLEVIELHDEAYNSWVKGARGGRWQSAEDRAARLIEYLGGSLDFYLRFYRADNRTGSKDQAPLAWFERLADHDRVA